MLESGSVSVNTTVRRGRRLFYRNDSPSGAPSVASSQPAARIRFSSPLQASDVIGEPLERYSAVPASRFPWITVPPLGVSPGSHGSVSRWPQHVLLHAAADPPALAIQSQNVVPAAQRPRGAASQGWRAQPAERAQHHREWNGITNQRKAPRRSWSRAPDAKLERRLRRAQHRLPWPAGAGSVTGKAHTAGFLGDQPEAGAQPRSTRRISPRCREGLTAASTGTPSNPEEPRPALTRRVQRTPPFSSRQPTRRTDPHNPTKSTILLTQKA